MVVEPSKRHWRVGKKNGFPYLDRPAAICNATYITSGTLKQPHHTPDDPVQTSREGAEKEAFLSNEVQNTPAVATLSERQDHRATLRPLTGAHPVLHEPNNVFRSCINGGLFRKFDLNALRPFQRTQKVSTRLKTLLMHGSYTRCTRPASFRHWRQEPTTAACNLIPSEFQTH